VSENVKNRGIPAEDILKPTKLKQKQILVTPMIIDRVKGQIIWMHVQTISRLGRVQTITRRIGLGISYLHRKYPE